MKDLISRQDAIDALWKALYEYEDKTEKQFQESDELDVGDWVLHRGFVQNMSDIDRQTIQNLPTVEAEPIRRGKWLTNIHRRTVCSECGFRPETETDYCPSCGAKMDVNQIVNQTVNQVSTKL